MGDRVLGYGETNAEGPLIGGTGADPKAIQQPGEVQRSATEDPLEGSMLDFQPKAMETGSHSKLERIRGIAGNIGSTVSKAIGAAAEKTHLDEAIGWVKKRQEGAKRAVGAVSLAAATGFGLKKTIETIKSRSNNNQRPHKRTPLTPAFIQARKR